MSIEASLKTLSKLTDQVAKTKDGAPRIGPGKRGSGRYGRRPDFAVIAAPSTRPDSGAGVTFHFKHSFVSKKNSISSGFRDQTSAPAHQRYIERNGAAEHLVDGDGVVRDISFGNLGSSKEERTDFWRKVEKMEGKAGRVQCRMIVELPHELSPAGREKAAKAFMKIMADRGFPHWAVIHAPDEHNDRRNFHLHAVYYDRPCTRLENGKWDFEIETEVKWKNGQTALKRPLKQPKDSTARGKEWIRELRREWAKASNEVLAKEGLAKRYDPRPYRESGIRKMPTAHLGNKLALAESQGIDTTIGAENSRREMRFRLSKPDAVYDRITGSLDKAIAGIRMAAQKGDAAGLKGDPRLAMMATLSCRRILSEGIKAAKAREANRLAVDVIGARLAKRAGFLDAEYDRLTLSTPKWLGEEDAFKIAASLWDERRLIDDAAADIAPFRAGCRQAVTSHEEHTRKLDVERQGAVAAMMQAFPALKQMLRPEELSDLVLPLADSQDGNATSFVGARRPEESRGTQSATPTATLAATLAATPTVNPAEAGRQLAHQAALEAAIESRGSDGKAEIAEDADKTRSVKNSAEPLDVVTTPETQDRDAANAKSVDAEASIHEIPGALSLADKAETKELEKALNAVQGWQLRYHYLATRDAADFSDDEAAAQRHTQALAVVEAEAQKRGLDLETGRMDPAKAKDRKAFEKHIADWQPLPEDPEFVREMTS